LDNGVSKDLEEKDAEIKALREQIEILQNKLAVSPLDVNIEEKEEEAIIAPPVVIDPFKILMQELEDSKIWMEEFLRMTKPILSGTESQQYRLMQGQSPSHQPKKKLNKKQIQRDIFEIDFMCD
jgi:hypothetical protein